MKTDLKHSDLVTFYTEGTNNDQALYNEQRSNLMLVAGNHYSKKGSKFWNRVRDEKALNSDQRIRLTKNHIQRICKSYENNILSYAPAVAIAPKNETELQDQKASELNNSVWQHMSQRHKMKQRTREFCQDYVRIGEAAAKIYWDDTKGEQMGYEPMVDEMGQQMIDPTTGQPAPDQSKPVFSGDLVIERIFGFNVFRAAEAKNMDDSWYIGFRKMVDISDLKKQVGEDMEKLKFVQESKDETFMVWDANNQGYKDSKNQCMVMEVYIRPCLTYPKGYYYIYTMSGILFEGELPFGIFPIIFTGFDEVPTNPRFFSIIKHLRPYQAEINRAASKMAEHQITLGDDKLLIQMGTKLQNGGTFPGVRAYQYAGNAPTVMAGRSGEQYLTTITQNIEEMYQIANMQEDMQEKPSQIDPYTMLFQSIEQKKKYMIYATKFMQFLIEMAEVSLGLIKNYVSDQALIPMIGSSERVNIAEFKNTTPLCYQIKVESGTEDMESRLGKQLMFNHIIQYAGAKLTPDQLGQMFRLSPYCDNEQGFEDLTMNYDNGTNLILALDRGEMMQPNMNDDSAYMIKRIVSRMRKSDFKFLSPNVQQLYNAVYNQFLEIQAEQQRKIQEAALGYIPMSGGAVVCDLYVPDPNNASKQMRARVPYDSLAWLLKRLEEQGMNQEALLQQQNGVLADLATKLKQNPPQQPSDGGPHQPMIGAQG